jgi:hypothetical protein
MQVTSPTVELDNYLTDGTNLFRVIDFVPGEAVLLENSFDGTLMWQTADALAAAAVMPVVPVGD